MENEIMNNTIENEELEIGTEMDLNDELTDLVNVEETSEEESQMNLVGGVAKLGIGFAAGFAAGKITEKAKNLKNHPEDRKPKEKKEHFWNKIHIQSPIKIDKKETVGDSKEVVEAEVIEPETEQPKKAKK